MFYFLFFILLLFLLLFVLIISISIYRHIKYGIPVLNARMAIQLLIQSLKKDKSNIHAVEFLSSHKHHKKWASVIKRMNEGFEFNESLEVFKNNNKNPLLIEIASILQQPDSLEKLEELKKDKKFILDGEHPIYQGGDLTSWRIF